MPIRAKSINRKSDVQITFFSKRDVHMVVLKLSTGARRALFWLGSARVAVERKQLRLICSFEF
jgi:hypothetical protein